MATSRAVTGCLLLCTALLSAPAGAQEPTLTDVEKACTSPRLQIRIAAAKKLALAGEAAVAPIREFTKQRGDDVVPVSLVEAFAEQGGSGPQVRTLLCDWADRREFFWRAQALRCLALRATPERRDDRDRFLRAIDDPAWLMRVFGAFGLERLGGDEWQRVLQDRDPRAASKLAALVLPTKPSAAVVQVLVDALDDHRTMLGDPFGQRRAQEAGKALRQWLGDAAAAAADTAALVAAAQARCGSKLTAPAPLRDLEVAFAGGIEVLSCSRGDLFVRWTADGRVWIDFAGAAIEIGNERWNATAAPLGGWQAENELGVVICDRMRWRNEQPPFHRTIAPKALPPNALEALKNLAATLDNTGASGPAEELRRRLDQFATGQ